MDFRLTPRQRELQDRAREAVERVVAPVASGVLPGQKLTPDQLRGIYAGLRPLGYLGSTVPESAGGAGMTNVDYGLLLEALAHGPVLLGEVVLPRLVHRLGNADQQRRWLGPLLAGDWISTSAITEPQAGSDVRGIRTAIVRAADGLRLRGRKKWIKLGGVSDLMAVLIVTDPERGAAAGTSRIVVERARSPWQAVEVEGVGMRNLSWAEIIFDDVPVDAGNLLGSPGEGTEAFYRGIEASRAFVAIEAVGIADHALSIAKAYVRERSAFGRPLAKFQDIQGRLADAAAELDAARLLSLRALALLDAGERCPLEASMAKAYATEAAVRVCGDAMDCMGAHGLSQEAGVEECWRTARMLTVIDGTSAIQRLIVGRELLGEAAFV
ncbi:MAG TPA: acyl-CoA dehydrogenase family protein [bacterium]|nr:acyl-CoA dehydrogenase family protein [bacterium]